jgi:hypothetical protein
MLPLYPGAKPCVNSGFCCKQAPCQFGEAISDDNPQCKYLEPLDDLRFICGKFEEIDGKPGSEIDPAFGAGCCMPLFNEDRQRIIASRS